MKKHRIIFAAILGLLVITGVSCRYPQPVFSLHKPEYRIIGSWQITHTYLNGTEIDSTNVEILYGTGYRANVPGAYYYIYADYVLQVMTSYNGEIRYSSAGNWYFQNDFKDLVLQFSILGKRYNYTAAIQKLSRKELIYEYDDEMGNHWKIHMNSRSSY